MSKVTSILLQIWEVLKIILKLPNWIWNLPVLNKLKGIRLTVIAWGLMLVNVGQAMDWNIIAVQLCDLLNCDPEVIKHWVNGVLAALALALKIEDNDEKKEFRKNNPPVV